MICWIVSNPTFAQQNPAPSSEPAPSPQGDTGEVPQDEPTPVPVPARSFVYEAGSGNAIYDYRVNSITVHSLVDEVVKAATGESTVASAWASLVKPVDIVGIKVSANGAPLFSTHPEVVSAIVAGLNEAGVPSENIVVWDRDKELLQIAGYRGRGAGYRLMWTDGNYDPQVFITAPIAGKLIFGDLQFIGKQPANFRSELNADPKEKDGVRGPALDGLSDRSYVSRVLTRVVTKVINVPVLADNVYCGLSGSLFNMTVQNIDNWRRLVQPPNSGDPSIPEAYADPRISGKVVLHIMDGLVALYAGGPTGNTNYAVQHGTIYASRDPVALDAIAVRTLDQWRSRDKLDTISKSAKWFQTAFLYGLGNCDLNRIELRDAR